MCAMKKTLKNATIVDVRTFEEFAVEHFPNAVNIPLDNIAQRIKEFKECKSQLLLIAELATQWNSSFYSKAKWN